MEGIAFHRLGLETSDDARREVMRRGVVPVTYQNGSDVVGFAVSMPVAMRLFGRGCLSGSAFEPIQHFTSKAQRYAAQCFSQWRTVTVHDRPEFVFMNRLLVESRWNNFQLLCSPRHIRVLAQHVDRPLWLSREIESGAFQLIYQGSNHPIPQIQARDLMISPRRRGLKEELERLGRPVIVGQRGKKIKAYAVPLSMKGDVKALGLARQTMTLEDLKKSRYNLAPDMYCVVYRHTPNGGMHHAKAHYILLSPNIERPAHDWVMAQYPASEIIDPPLTDAPINQECHSVQSIHSVGMASTLARLGLLASKRQDVLGFEIQAFMGGPRPYWLIGDWELAKQMMCIPIMGERCFVQARTNQANAGLSWVMSNANWLAETPKLDDIMAGTHTEKLVYDKLQAVFASFSRPNNRNLVILPPQAGLPTGLALTNSADIAHMASTVRALRQNGVTLRP